MSPGAAAGARAGASSASMLSLGQAWKATKSGLLGVCDIASKKVKTYPAFTYIAVAIRIFQMLSFLTGDRAGAPWPSSLSPLEIASSLTNLRGYTSWLQEEVVRVAFWLATAWVVCLLVLLCWGVNAFAKNRVSVLWPLRLLRVMGQLSSGILFIPLLQCLLTLQETYGQGSSANGASPVVTIVVTILSTILTGLSFLFASVFYNPDCLSSQPSAKSHGRCDVILLSIQVVLVVQSRFTEMTTWLRIFILAAMGVVWLLSYAYALPYYVHAMNRYEVAGATLYLWGVLCFVLNVSYRWTDAAIMLYCGIPLAVGAGIAICDWRANRIMGTPSALLGSAIEVELKARFILHSVLFGHPLLRNGNSARANGLLWAGAYSSSASSTATAAHITPPTAGGVTAYGAAATGRSSAGAQHAGVSSPPPPPAPSSDYESLIGMDDEGSEEGVHEGLRSRLPADVIAELLSLYRHAASRFRTSAMLHVFCGRFYGTVLGNRHMQLSHLLQAERRNPALDLAFVVFQARKSADDTGGEGSSAMNRVAWEKWKDDATRLVQVAAQKQLAFWTELMDPCPDLARLHRLSSETNGAISGAEVAFFELTALNSQSLAIISMQAAFNLHVTCNGDKAQALLAEAERLEDSKSKEHRAEGAKTTRLQIMGETALEVWAENTAMVTVSATPREVGSIRTVNAQACKLFGVPKMQMERRSVFTLLPPGMAELHEDSLRQYVASGEGLPGIAGYSRVSFVLNKAGMIVPVVSMVRDAPPDDGPPSFIWAMRELRSSMHYMLLDANGCILAVCSSSQALLGIEPANLATGDATMGDFVVEWTTREWFDEMLSPSGSTCRVDVVSATSGNDWGAMQAMSAAVVPVHSGGKGQAEEGGDDADSLGQGFGSQGSGSEDEEEEEEDGRAEAKPRYNVPPLNTRGTAAAWSAPPGEGLGMTTVAVRRASTMGMGMGGVGVETSWLKGHLQPLVLGPRGSTHGYVLHWQYIPSTDTIAIAKAEAKRAHYLGDKSFSAALSSTSPTQAAGSAAPTWASGTHGASRSFKASERHTFSPSAAKASMPTSLPPTAVRKAVQPRAPSSNRNLSVEQSTPAAAALSPIRSRVKQAGSPPLVAVPVEPVSLPGAVHHMGGGGGGHEDDGLDAMLSMSLDETASSSKEPAGVHITAVTEAEPHPSSLAHADAKEAQAERTPRPKAGAAPLSPPPAPGPDALVVHSVLKAATILRNSVPPSEAGGSRSGRILKAPGSSHSAWDKQSRSDGKSHRGDDSKSHRGGTGSVHSGDGSESSRSSGVAGTMRSMGRLRRIVSVENPPLLPGLRWLKLAGFGLSTMAVLLSAMVAIITRGNFLQLLEQTEYVGLGAARMVYKASAILAAQELIFGGRGWKNLTAAEDKLNRDYITGNTTAFSDAHRAMFGLVQGTSSASDWTSRYITYTQFGIAPASVGGVGGKYSVLNLMEVGEAFAALMKDMASPTQMPPSKYREYSDGCGLGEPRIAALNVEFMRGGNAHETLQASMDMGYAATILEADQVKLTQLIVFVSMSGTIALVCALVFLPILYKIDASADTVMLQFIRLPYPVRTQLYLQAMKRVRLLRRHYTEDEDADDEASDADEDEDAPKTGRYASLPNAAGGNESAADSGVDGEKAGAGGADAVHSSSESTSVDWNALAASEAVPTDTGKGLRNGRKSKQGFMSRRMFNKQAEEKPLFRKSGSSLLLFRLRFLSPLIALLIFFAVIYGTFTVLVEKTVVLTSVAAAADRRSSCARQAMSDLRKLSFLTTDGQYITNTYFVAVDAYACVRDHVRLLAYGKAGTTLDQAEYAQHIQPVENGAPSVLSPQLAAKVRAAMFSDACPLLEEVARGEGKSFNLTDCAEFYGGVVTLGLSTLVEQVWKTVLSVGDRQLRGQFIVGSLQEGYAWSVPRETFDYTLLVCKPELGCDLGRKTNPNYDGTPLSKSFLSDPTYLGDHAAGLQPGQGTVPAGSVPYWIAWELGHPEMKFLEQADSLYLTPALDAIADLYRKESYAAVSEFLSFLNTFVPAYMVVFVVLMATVFNSMITSTNKDIQAKRAMLLYLPVPVVARAKTIRQLVADIIASDVDGGGAVGLALVNGPGGVLPGGAADGAGQQQQLAGKQPPGAALGSARGAAPGSARAAAAAAGASAGTMKK